MAFCRQHNIPYSTFATWVQKRRKQLPKPPEEELPTKLPIFAEMLINPDHSVEKIHPPIRITLPEGIHLEISSSLQVPLALEMIRALSSRRSC